ncbi:hypothetical protein CCR94_05710 [Rhodoblastus sphagnicola]|uniref:Endolytic murein transglycosylase n=1 Tax=Rhodoblastus sphagnicola TaxID=333368 RepID=A0A2S6NCZ1_9HYPH|nr:endolytic transglycosylase MltG [Rhodoblastus sphagnicola]MBB4196323.1 UPF0755 protein [Rhodoblastus sphagnicola]PPQ32464.1 hypothetical protein CCR94_05710 [Rhodoblastus sphagnicola]
MSENVEPTGEDKPADDSFGPVSRRSSQDSAARRIARGSSATPGSNAARPDSAPPPPRKKKRSGMLAAISGVMTFLLVAAVIAGLGVVMASRGARSPGPLTADRVVVIPQGADADEISQILVDQGVIDSRLSFAIVLSIEGLRGKLKAGEYLFRQGGSLQEAIDAIVQGRAILHTLTIPEGLTSQQIVDKVRGDDSLAGDIREIPREGALLPETYKFQRGDTRDKLLQKMARDHKALVEEIWRRRNSDLPLTSPTDMVTLASIVEKETGRADERPRVASVFLNRLRKHMRLQSDPTVVYGLVAGQGPLGRTLTRDDLESRTPYNTYVIDGLPPGPIANPGRAALEAVANPSRTADLYFVADGTGGHVFAETLDVHNKNVQRWRQLDPNHKRDERGEIYRSPYGAPATGLADTRLPAPSLRREAAALARLAPGLPNAPPAPRRVGELALAHGVAPRIESGDDSYADAQMGGVTKAENLLDGPAEELSSAGAASRRTAANLLDGAAEPVDGSMAFSPAPQAGAMAPNGKPRVYDASAGTALDPLLDKSWDLNSAKTVDTSSPFGKAGK